MKVFAPFVRALASRAHSRLALALGGTLVVGSLALAQTVAPAIYQQSLPTLFPGLVRLPAVEEPTGMAVAYNEDAPLPDNAGIPPTSRVRAQTAMFTTEAPRSVAQSQGLPLIDTTPGPSPAHDTGVFDAPLPDASLSIPSRSGITSGPKIAPLPGEDSPPPAALMPVPSRALAANEPLALPVADDAATQPSPALTPNAGATVAEDQKLGREPADTSLEFLRAATVLLEPGQWEFDYGIEYAWQQTPGLVLGDTNNDNDLEVLGISRVRNRQLFSPFAVRYGWSERLQLFAILPVGGALTEVSSPFDNEFHTVGGVGDLRTGFNYLLREHDACSPDITFNFDITAPTGPDQFDRGLNSPFLGGGFWRVAAAVNFIKSIDPVVIFGSVGYDHGFGEEHRGLYIEPGERFFYTCGAGFAVNDSVTFSTVLVGAVETNLLVDHVAVPNSSLEPIVLRTALTAFVSECQIVEPYVRFGLTEDANQVDLGVTLTRRY